MIKFLQTLLRRIKMDTKETGKIIENAYPNTPFSIRAFEQKHGESHWHTWRVEVWRHHRVIGEYTRGYSGMVEDTFYPFQSQSGQWYALYSSDYTATRVARLSSTFEDWCGEEGHNSFGFCPVEFYVPSYCIVTRPHESMPNGTYIRFNNDDDFNLLDVDDPQPEGTYYTSYGFVSGCVWGDDSSWKLRFIDLRYVDDKQITITEKFGYYELPDDKTLQECIHHDEIGWFRILGAKSFSI